MSAPNTARSPRDTSAAIDATNEYGPPIDFSFKMLTSFIDVQDEVPRKTQHKAVKNQSGKFCSTGLKFNNNTLTDFEGFEDTVTSLLEKPEELSSLDLSFNDLLGLDAVVLNYPCIKMLYIHGNRIEKLEEIDKLAGLPNLISLTVHGNPIEDQAGCRSYILSRLPRLKTLNFSGVTKADLKNASTWSTMYGKQRKKKRRKEED